MSLMARRRFWTTTDIQPGEGGFAVLLDDKPLRTPYKSALTVPNRALAQALADEWAQVDGKIDPETMPMTRSVNSAIDKVAARQAQVVAMLAAYAGTDLICYRAETPLELATRQATAWDPWLAWAETRHDAPLVAVAGVMHHPQPEPSLRRLERAVASHDAYGLTALHDMIALTGSCVLGLAMSEGLLTADQAWALSRIDEDWQAEQWGRDDEAEAMAATKQAALRHAENFLALARKADG